MFITYAMNIIFPSELVVQPGAIQNWSEHGTCISSRMIWRKKNHYLILEMGVQVVDLCLWEHCRVRIEKFSNKRVWKWYGSPSMTDIEDFFSAYRALLGEAEQLGTIPDNISLEVSSPGVERIFWIPGDLERFSDLPMYVKYITDEVKTGSIQESDEILKLVSFDLETRCCTWSLADVRVNREKTGQGRPLSKKQREVVADIL
ncbi:uncharacterized protein [Aristolochia californica]